MKKTLLLLLIAVCVGTTAVHAQKIGRVNMEIVLSALPESDSAVVYLETFSKELEGQLQTMQEEGNKKMAEFQQKQSTYTPAVLEVRQKEIIDFQTKIEATQRAAEQDFMEKRTQLFQPIIEKIRAEIAKTSKAQGLTMVVDLAQSQDIVYLDEATSPDITDMVIKALGGTRKPATAPAPAAR